MLATTFTASIKTVRDRWATNGERMVVVCEFPGNKKYSNDLHYIPRALRNAIKNGETKFAITTIKPASPLVTLNYHKATGDSLRYDYLLYPRGSICAVGFKSKTGFKFGRKDARNKKFYICIDA